MSTPTSEAREAAGEELPRVLPTPLARVRVDDDATAKPRPGAVTRSLAARHDVNLLERSGSPRKQLPAPPTVAETNAALKRVRHATEKRSLACLCCSLTSYEHHVYHDVVQFTRTTEAINMASLTRVGDDIF